MFLVYWNFVAWFLKFVFLVIFQFDANDLNKKFQVLLGYTGVPLCGNAPGQAAKLLQIFIQKPKFILKVD